MNVTIHTTWHCEVLVSVYFAIHMDTFLRWSPSVQRLVVKRMTAITIQSTKLLK